MKNWKPMYKNLVILSLIFTITACNTGNNPGGDPRPAQPEPMTSVTALSYLSLLKLGVNISCSFDSYPYDPAWNSDNYSETCWGNPVINQALFDGIANAGFDIVRIPITWIGFIGNAPDYKVSESRLSRVAEVVNMAHNAGLKAIINTHHDDGNFNGMFWDCGWLRVDIAAVNENVKNETTAKFRAVWRQIAEYFIDYGDYLLFEDFNEPTNAGWSSPSAVETNTLNEFHQIFVDTVRGTGGNNSKRFLILPGFAANQAYTVGGLVLPSDPQNNGNDRLIVAFHYYDPHAFTHDLTMSSWGSDYDKSQVNTRFNSMKNTYIDNGIAVILDEFGLKYKADIEEAQKTYISYIAGVATERGMPALFWDDSKLDGFMLFNRDTGRLFPQMESYAQAMKDAVR